MPAITGMTFSDALGVIGVIVSCLFGVWGIYLTLRRARYPASLTFVREQSVALLGDFATKLPNLTVLYKDIPIDKSVVLISGYLVNDGGVDLTPEMVEKPLLCRLPGACSWLEFKITTAAKALHAESNILNSSEVEIRLGLFRRDESFAFQALVLLDDVYAKKKTTTFNEYLHWSHRIASLGDVKTRLMPLPETRSKRAQIVRKGFGALMAAAYFCVGISQTVGVRPFGVSPSIEYEFHSDAGTALVRLIANSDGSTTVLDIRSGNEQKVNLVDFVKAGTFLPVRSEQPEQRVLFPFAGLITLTFGGVMLFVTFAADFKRYRTRRLVSASVKKDQAQV
ncbi:hypothetical protein NUH87_08735 [Pseudomonas batumici]|uniref:hypothetical protein n=1 Tax=Pseudomonas batumici TaxID=226910 RepID=UPI0030D0367A